MLAKVLLKIFCETFLWEISIDNCSSVQINADSFKPSCKKNTQTYSNSRKYNSAPRSLPNFLLPLRPLPNYAGGILNGTYISTVRPTVHTNPWRKRSFTKTLENADFSFSCGEKTFWKRWRHGNHVISLSVFSKLSSDCCARSVEENILMRFQSERPPFSKSSGVVRTESDFSRLQLLTW